MRSNDLGRRHRWVVLCALVAAVWVTAGTTFDAAKKIKIKTQVDDRFSFDGLHAWTWSPDGTGQVKMATTANADPEALRQRVDPVIVPLVEQELSKKGFTKSEKADLIVNYYVLVTVGQSSQYMGQFVGSIPQWGLPPFEGSTTALRAFPVGTLLIDIVSPSEKAVVWRGAAQAELDLEAPQEQRKQRLEQAVRDVLAKFPPKPKKK